MFDSARIAYKFGPTNSGKSKICSLDNLQNTEDVEGKMFPIQKNDTWRCSHLRSALSMKACDSCLMLAAEPEGSQPDGQAAV